MSADNTPSEWWKGYVGYKLKDTPFGKIARSSLRNVTVREGRALDPRQTILQSIMFDFVTDAYRELGKSVRRTKFVLERYKAGKLGTLDDVQLFIDRAEKISINTIFDTIIEPIYYRSQMYVPVDTGRLKASGYAEYEISGDTTYMSVGYARNNDPYYAVAVHEVPDWYHEPPTRYKYLETAVNEIMGGVEYKLRSELVTQIFARNWKDTRFSTKQDRLPWVEVEATYVQRQSKKESPLELPIEVQPYIPKE